MSIASSRRRSVRRSVRARCQAVELSGFRLVGERLLDLSTRGALLACDSGITRGDRILLSFRCPNSSEWIDTEAEVHRVIEGRRDGDLGYCAGLRFVGMEREMRHELLCGLAGTPPRVPLDRSIEIEV
jgi:hypothetical protein